MSLHQSVISGDRTSCRREEVEPWASASRNGGSHRISQDFLCRAVASPHLLSSNLSMTASAIFRPCIGGARQCSEECACDSVIACNNDLFCLQTMPTRQRSSAWARHLFEGPGTRFGSMRLAEKSKGNSSHQSLRGFKLLPCQSSPSA